MDHFFSQELIGLANKDLEVREALISQGQLSEGYHPEMERVHRSNAQRLREIIKEIGFPTISKVGENASNAAWLIIQHSIGEPGFMKECYKMMMENAHDIKLQNLAYLFDRIQVFQGKPQKYGTQLIADGRVYPVEDKHLLNSEREKVNLPSFTVKEINGIPEAEDIPEIDGNDTEYTIWRKKTGWI
ncbi:DUF6624 domain-containing protein [Chryseobacterium flavum]|uniref:DUF6624 domain-containing protein n=1 Tax=Chryseobacterium flavum TaxID=415851 RepID=UPI0028ACA2CE|nr:DUF6624 domain-containing protein [Chryseobacterium flavum]